MQILRPLAWRQALAMKSARPEALAISGGTDVMVALRSGQLRPGALLDLSRIPALSQYRPGPRHVYLGAGVTYTRLSESLAGRLPGLAMAAGNVGSRQVRNRGTIGGSLGTAAPAGDLHPMLLASGADIQLSSVRGSRWVPAERFYLGPAATALAADELIAGVRVPLAAGPQRFTKIGRRHGLVKAVCSFAVALDPPRRRVGTGIGALGPPPRRAAAAEDLLAVELARAGLWESRAQLGRDLLDQFGQWVAGAAEPDTDLHATAAYRRHALAVLARRSLRDAWEALRRGSES